jgi:hypothetical protein
MLKKMTFPAASSTLTRTSKSFSAFLFVPSTHKGRIKGGKN